MTSARRVILAFAPGRREFGIATLDQRELVYFAVREFENRSSITFPGQQVSEAVQNAIRIFHPDVIALRAISKYQRTSVALELIAEIIKLEATSSKIPIVEISLGEVRSLSTFGKATQKNAFNTIALFYPELQQFIGRPSKWQNEYYNKLLSAVAVAVACMRQLPLQS